MHLVFMAICLTAKAICAQDCMCKMFVEWQLFLCRRDMYFLCSHQIREVKSGWGGLRTLWYTRKHKLTTLDYWVPITTTCQFDGLGKIIWKLVPCGTFTRMKWNFIIKCGVFNYYLTFCGLSAALSQVPRGLLPFLFTSGSEFWALP